MPTFIAPVFVLMGIYSCIISAGNCIYTRELLLMFCASAVHHKQSTSIAYMTFFGKTI